MSRGPQRILSFHCTWLHYRRLCDGQAVTNAELNGSKQFLHYFHHKSVIPNNSLPPVACCSIYVRALVLLHPHPFPPPASISLLSTTNTASRILLQCQELLLPILITFFHFKCCIQRIYEIKKLLLNRFRPSHLYVDLDNEYILLEIGLLGVRITSFEGRKCQ